MSKTMTKYLIALSSVLAFAGCDSMPNRSASDSKSMPSTSTSTSTSSSDATSAPTAAGSTSDNGAAASGKTGDRNGDAGISGGAGAAGTMEPSTGGIAPK